ncbi:hypothetical protein AG1IA_05564 [Rhizoctonia solani AG-1 IA]|uniref:Uncharacterized protein n=1 Tax=Thanatephorus cucumeris (strain AG1-IA) TaxID=983506 RepID=L8WVN0_THACA|nr:hypothetical protein AG1IA_05564 [Rhizoctonia solani AG-1 IA]
MRLSTVVRWAIKQAAVPPVTAAGGATKNLTHCFVIVYVDFQTSLWSAPMEHATTLRAST